ncbi:hypothetical protein [Dyadobacter tibetensis]|uniref:hypothetical protein n=1 Tax=Dyadobacter tibetensis TaxID=1211851 RepID=UPI001E58E0E1|nr:hypothetical protein [Dyadobacter tibetensis]
MMSYRFLFFLLAVFSAPPLWAQSIRLGYFGESITHYGLKGGVEWEMGSHYQSGRKVKKGWLISPTLACYRHPHNHIGILLSSELTYRRRNQRGGIIEAGLSPGIFRYFLDGTTYQPDDGGVLHRVRLAGGNAFMPSVFMGAGKDLSLRRQVNLTLFTRINLMHQRPYNTGGLMRFSLEAGIVSPLKKP